MSSKNSKILRKKIQSIWGTLIQTNENKEEIKVE